MLPATFFMAPMAAFAALGMSFAIIHQASPGGLGLIAVLLMLKVLAAFLGAIIGTTATWAALTISTDTMRRSVIRSTVIWGIVIGLADVVYWAGPVLDQQRKALDYQAAILWLLMLLGPIATGVHHLIRLWRFEPA